MPKPAGSGRKPYHDVAMESVTIRAPRSMWQGFARSVGMSLSELVRTAVDDYIESDQELDVSPKRHTI